MNQGLTAVERSTRSGLSHKGSTLELAPTQSIQSKTPEVSNQGRWLEMTSNTALNISRWIGIALVVNTFTVGIVAMYIIVRVQSGDIMSMQSPVLWMSDEAEPVQTARRK